MSLVCVVFLFRLRSALVAIITLPLAVLLAMLSMRWIGLTSNIMSLGGIAIAIGAMVDAAIVMIENAHKHLEREQAKPKEAQRPHLEVLIDAGKEVGPSLFFSLLDHYGELLAGILPAGPGGTAVQAAGLHQVIQHVLRGAVVDYGDAVSDDAADPRKNLA